MTDIREELCMRFLDVLRESDPVIAELVGDYATWGIHLEAKRLWFEFANPTSDIVSETVYPARDVLTRIAQRSLGNGWRAELSFGASA